MNLADRYDLSESVTTGAVETFPARDILTGEQVLVHVFESAATRPANVPTIQWVLEAFKRVAPPPKELVVNAGRYAGTAFVYLVTKMPDPNSLQEWIEAYGRYGLGSKEIAPIPKDECVQQPQLQVPSTTMDNEQETTEMPVLSIEPAVRAPTTKAANPEAVNRAADNPESTRTRTGTFTSLFISNFGKGDFAGTAATPEQPRSITEQLSTGPSTHATSALDLGNPPATAVAPDAGTGDFTKFFKGPFSGEPSLDTPKNLSVTTPVPVATVGEFTRTFGSVTRNDEIQPVDASLHGDTERLSLTQILAQPPTRPEEPPPPAQSFPVFEPKPTDTRPRDVPDGLDAVKLESRPGAAHFAPLPGPEPPIVRESSATVGFEKDNATRLFSSSARQQDVALPVGPSEYTRVIARPTLPPEPEIEQSPAGARPQPSVSVPPVSMALPPPPPMHIPGMPPTPPVSVAPPAVKIPQVPPVPKPPFSYWPLILGMTVLFFMAALLVMYFVLKH